MRRRLICGMSAALLGLVLATLLLWLGTAAAAAMTPPPTTRYVATDGADSGDCSTVGGRCATVQYAVDVANLGDEIHVAHGTYAPGGTVAVIVKSVTIRGGYEPGTFAGPDPDMYQTVLNAQWGGSVISMTNAGEVTLQFLTLTHGDGTGNCGSSGCGGGIYATVIDLYVSNCTIEDNRGTVSGIGYGGGMYVSNSAPHHVNIYGSRILSNTANAASTSGGSGGGVYIHAGSVSVVESQIVDNLAKLESSGSMPFGGGLYLSSLTGADVLTNVIKDNRTGVSGGPTGWGGGIYLSSGSGIYVAGNRIEGNEATSGGGGGIDVGWSDVHVARNEIVDNTSSSGGGLYIRSLTPVTVSNNLIARNTAYYGSGVIVVNSSLPPSQALLVNNTIVGNSHIGVRGYENVVVTLTNNLIAGHSIGVTTTVPASATITADHNLFWNTADPIIGTNAIEQDPVMGASYRLLDGSPALDAGVTISWLTRDLDGRQRPIGAYDLGAYEGVWKEVFLPLVLRSYQ